MFMAHQTPGVCYAYVLYFIIWFGYKNKLRNVYRGILIDSLIIAGMSSSTAAAHNGKAGVESKLQYSVVQLWKACIVI